MVEEVVVDMNAEFLKLAGPYRVELLAYCYRLLGSVADAEDTVQETYLHAWRSFASFEGRSSVRTWLYRIATNSYLWTGSGHCRRRWRPRMRQVRPGSGWPDSCWPRRCSVCWRHRQCCSTPAGIGSRPICVMPDIWPGRCTG